MKSCLLLLLSFGITLQALAQVSGNINYQNQVRYSDSNINIGIPGNRDIVCSVKGMANVTADVYVAIFNVTQTGKSTEEVNQLIDERIDAAMTKIKSKPDVKTYVDMISFVPIYEYDIEKKIFSKKTYNEVPAGFELKKNIHIEYQDPNLLDSFIAALSGQEIYDLVRVDYFSNELESMKRQLRTKAQEIMQEKLSNYEAVLSVKLDSVQKQVVDGYRVVLPVEMYKSYQAYNSSSLSLKRNAKVNNAEKSTTLYYQPVIDKEFDFVINPTILEPVIQVLYEIKLVVSREKEAIRKTDKQYILVTPNGDLKDLGIGH